MPTVANENKLSYAWCCLRDCAGDEGPQPSYCCGGGIDPFRLAWPRGGRTASAKVWL